MNRKLKTDSRKQHRTEDCDAMHFIDFTVFLCVCKLLLCICVLANILGNTSVSVSDPM